MTSRLAEEAAYFSAYDAGAEGAMERMAEKIERLRVPVKEFDEVSAAYNEALDDVLALFKKKS